MKGFMGYLVLLTEIGLTIAVSVIIGYAAGSYLDRALGTWLVFTLLGAFLGVAGGFYSVYRLIGRGVDKTEGK